MPDGGQYEVSAFVPAPELFSYRSCFGKKRKNGGTVYTATGVLKSHLEILKLGVSEWNKWRVERTNIAPDLKGADLTGASLAGADLRAVNFKGADLRGANLRGANLKAADLRAANLREAVLWSASLTGADLRAADLTGADLRGVNFRAANLMNAIMVGVSTNDYTDFRHATVTGARLWEDAEPVAEDWNAEMEKVVAAYTLNIVVKIEVDEPIGFSDIASVVPLLENVFYEYERSFVISLRPAAGDLIADACLYRLEVEREQIFRCIHWKTGATGLRAAAYPIAFQILGRTVFRDVEDIWKRITMGGVIKKALVNRAGQTHQELCKILKTALARSGGSVNLEITMKAEMQMNKAPNLTIEIRPGKNKIAPPSSPAPGGPGK
jgi:hypothetical protein